MATPVWKGGTTAVAQVDIVTAGGTWESTDVASLTLEGEDGTTSTLDTVAGSTTIATIMTTVAAAFNASVHPFFTQITAVAGATTITFTADTAGTPFYLTAATTETGGGGSDSQTFARSASVTNKGPYDYNTPGNWVGGSVPAASDNVIITGSTKILYGLKQSGTAIASFTRSPGCTATIGGAGLYLKLNCTGFTDYGTGAAYYDFGSSTVAPRVVNTASASAGQYGTHLLGSGMTTLRVEGGSVEVALAAGQTATVATVVVSGTLSRVALGTGVTLTTYKQSSGAGLVLCAATTVESDSGTLETGGAGAITTLTCNGGTIISNSTGTITTANANAGTIDLTKSRVARTITTPNISAGTYLLDTNYVTLTNKITPSGRVKITSTTNF